MNLVITQRLLANLLTARGRSALERRLLRYRPLLPDDVECHCITRSLQMTGYSRVEAVFGPTAQDTAIKDVNHIIMCWQTSSLLQTHLQLRCPAPLGYVTTPNLKLPQECHGTGHSHQRQAKHSPKYHTCLQISCSLEIQKWAGQRSRYSDCLRAGRSGDRIPVEARFSAPVQTGPEAHPASCAMGTGSYPGVSCSRSVTLTAHLLLVPRSKIEQSYTFTLHKGLCGL